MIRFFTNKIFILFLSILIGNTVLANDIKFVQVTDTHYQRNSEYANKVLTDTIKDINGLKGVSFVVFTGDNINRPNPEDLARFVQKANQLKIPYYLVIGNHEVYKQGGLSKENYIKIVKDNNFLYKPSKPNYVFKKNGFVFIVADGAKEVIPGSIGYFRDETLKWLDEQLTKYEEFPVVILQHYPLLEPAKHKSHRVHQPEKYFAVLNKHKNVIAILSGHYHVNGEKMQDGIYHISTPTLMNAPNYYKIIDIVTTPEFSPMIYTELRAVEEK